MVRIHFYGNTFSVQVSCYSPGCPFFRCFWTFILIFFFYFSSRLLLLLCPIFYFYRIYSFFYSFFLFIICFYCDLFLFFIIFLSFCSSFAFIEPYFLFFRIYSIDGIFIIQYIFIFSKSISIGIHVAAAVFFNYFILKLAWIDVNLVMKEYFEIWRIQLDYISLMSSNYNYYN